MKKLTAILRTLRESEAGRREPFGVMLRLVGWQLWRRVLRRPMLVPTITGTRLRLLPGAADSLSAFWYFGAPDFEELAFTLHLLREDELFVDVGANQGGWSLIAAGRGARVFSFEPVPLTRERLESNLSANPETIRQRVRVFPFGLSDRDEQATFTADLDAANHLVSGQVAPTGRTITVDLVKADDILRAERPVLIKIDVEGEELRVLQGARNILAAPSLQAVVMETFRPFNFTKPALIAAEALLKEQGFLPAAYDPWRRELRFLKESHEGTQNTIYVRDTTEMQQRLRQARTVRIWGQEI